jgi:Rrf2 family protein
MLMFAKAEPNSSLTLSEISINEGLSLPYAGKLLMILKKADLVRAVRGRNGGYILARPADQITLQEIFGALGDSLYGRHHCERYSDSDDACIHSDDCRVGGLWNVFDHYIQGILQRVTLSDIANGKLDIKETIGLRE